VQIPNDGGWLNAQQAGDLKVSYQDHGDELDMFGLSSHSFMLCAGRESNNLCATFTLSNYGGSGYMTRTDTRVISSTGTGNTPASFSMKLAIQSGANQNAYGVLCYVDKLETMPYCRLLNSFTPGAGNYMGPKLAVTKRAVFEMNMLHLFILILVLLCFLVLKCIVAVSCFLAAQARPRASTY
jgi:hypothetical protein